LKSALARPDLLIAPWIRILVALAALISAAASQPAPLEAYGRLPSLEHVRLSPDGTRFAFVKDVDTERIIVIKSLTDGALLGGLHIKDAKVRSVEWADDNHLLILTSETSLPDFLSGDESEWPLLQVFDIATRKTRPVPDYLREQDVMNVIAGRIMVRRVDGHTTLFFPGIYLTTRTQKALLKVDLDSGRQRMVRYGSPDTLDWLVDSEGNVVAEEDYSERKKRWSVSMLRDGKLQEVAGGQADISFPRMLGFGPVADTLLMQAGPDEEPAWSLLSLKDGSPVPAIGEGKALDDPIMDRLTHRAIGGSYWDDDDERYVFFEPRLQRSWDAIVRAFAGDHVDFVSASADLKKILVLVDGPKFGYGYRLVDLGTHTADPVGDVYEGITEPMQVRPIRYPAADNLEIPGYVTLPKGRVAHGLPLVVLVHGGPESRDTARFDWWSQSLADQGYAVLRSNFRGSAVSSRFTAAGFGEFGRKMQTDLSDGVRYLVKEGIADPARVCIVGASYGGYAALAGVTLDAGVYRCAVSVAGISDLKAFLRWVNEGHLARNNREQRYWDRFIGVSGPGDPLLEKISPIRRVESVSVPVLLIHGKDDTVVPYDQSDDMYDALRHAGKTVEFVKLKQEDHWLSRGETRLQMLQATVAFLRKHNPPD
jgi:dipeptidyl aminopeptidase/acylaminoacyl peptidase